MAQEISSLPPMARYVDYSAEIPELDAETIGSTNIWSGNDGVTFADFLDVVNPLHHLPIIGTIYRAITGDEISLGARLLGSGLFGGPLGFLAAGINAAFEEISGGNIAQHAIALFEEITGYGDEEPQLALEPQTTKSGGVVSLAPLAQPAQTLAATTSPQTVNFVPKGANAPPETLHGPVSGNTATTLLQGVQRLPTALNTPIGNNIVKFNDTTNDAISHRISKTILDGQMAQAQILLASLSDGTKITPKQNQDKEATHARPVQAATGSDALQLSQLARQNIPPNGASAVWFQQAMGRALDLYESSHELKPSDEHSHSSNQ